jgi:hypothetical protein
MVKAPIMIQYRLSASKQSCGSLSQGRISRCRIMYVKQRLGETVEVVDSRGEVHGGYARAFSKPVGGNTQNGRRFGDFFPLLFPARRKRIVFYPIHRRAMAHKKDGHLCGFFQTIGEASEIRQSIHVAKVHPGRYFYRDLS